MIRVFQEQKRKLTRYFSPPQRNFVREYGEGKHTPIGTKQGKNIDGASRYFCLEGMK
jgi:hypothetical protein